MAMLGAIFVEKSVLLQVLLSGCETFKTLTDVEGIVEGVQLRRLTTYDCHERTDL